MALAALWMETYTAGYFVWSRDVDAVVVITTETEAERLDLSRRLVRWLGSMQFAGVITAEQEGSQLERMLSCVGNVLSLRLSFLAG
jgi:hypothetical protein